MGAIASEILVGTVGDHVQSHCQAIPCRVPVISPATRNRTRDHLIAAAFYSQMLYQLSYSRLVTDPLPAMVI